MHIKGLTIEERRFLIWTLVNFHPRPGIEQDYKQSLIDQLIEDIQELYQHPEIMCPRLDSNQRPSV